jgi:DNA uptake protein ComE-like DNA-binding protein
MRATRLLKTATKRRAYVLIAVLIVIVVLSLAAYRFTDAMTSEFTVAVRTSDAAQTKAFAASGIHYAMGMLADPATFSGTLNYNPYDNAGVFSAQTIGPSDTKRGGGKFSLIAVGDTFTGSGESRYAVRYGVTDESGKLNINAFLKLDTTGNALHDALMKLPNMTEEIADAIVDYVDSDDTARAAGAESSYYQGLNPPYQAKNGPVNSIDELLLVRGVTPQLLFGSDRNKNGKLDPGEDASSDFSRGWAEFLTVYGREVDVDFNGNPRTWLNDTELDGPTMYATLSPQLGEQLADYLLAAKMYGTSAVTTTSTTTAAPASTGTTTSTVSMTVSSRGTTSVAMTASTTSSGTGSSSNSTPKTVQGTAADLHTAVTADLGAGKAISKSVKSLSALYNTQVTLPKAAGAPADAPTVVVASPLNNAAQAKTMLPLLMEYTTTRDPSTDYDFTPRINLVTAPPEVIAGIPNITQAEADAIVTARDGLVATDPETTTGGFIFSKANVSPAKFANLEKYITGKTMVYRIHSVGYFGQGGPTTRIEAVIDTNLGYPRILYYRDISDLGKGFDLPK